MTRRNISRRLENIMLINNQQSPIHHSSKMSTQLHRHISKGEYIGKGNLSLKWLGIHPSLKDEPCFSFFFFLFCFPGVILHGRPADAIFQIIGNYSLVSTLSPWAQIKFPKDSRSTTGGEGIVNALKRKCLCYTGKAFMIFPSSADLHAMFHHWDFGH